MPAISRLRHGGIGVDHSERTASELYLEFLPLANAKKVSLLDDKRTLDQFAGLDRRTGIGGRERVVHHEKRHDDKANAVAGAAWISSITAKNMEGGCVTV